MKVLKVLSVLVLFVCFALPVTAKTNSVTLSGDLAKDNRLVIDVDWTVDSAKYPGMTREQIMEKVQDEVWDKVFPKIVKATKDIGVPIENSNFVLVSEHDNLIQKRPNGTKLYSVKIQIEYTPGQASAAAAVPASAPKKAPKYEDALNQRWDNEL